MKRDMIIDALEASPADLRRVIRPLSAEALTWKDGEQWSISEVINHLFNIDKLYMDRFTRIVNEDGPAISQIEPETTLAVDGGSALDVLERWESGRTTMCMYLTDLKPGDWNRYAMHNKRGRTTLRNEVELLVQHDTNHIAQATVIRQSWEAYQERSNRETSLE
jgi:uncharacterized damage-inducible protein DinB